MVAEEGEEGVVVVVELHPGRGCRPEVVERTRLNSERVLASLVGCRSFTIDDRGPSGPVVVLTRWDSREALGLHLRTAMAAENVQSYVGLLAAPMIPHVVPTRSPGDDD